jgi:hypothetical protein
MQKLRGHIDGVVIERVLLSPLVMTVMTVSKRKHRQTLAGSKTLATRQAALSTDLHQQLRLHVRQIRVATQHHAWGVERHNPHVSTTHDISPTLHDKNG